MILSSTIMGQGAPLIILHGLFGESKNWISIAKKLEYKFEIHLLDQRNHGDSFHHFEHNYVVLAKDLYNYIQDKALKNCSIIGHSMGGKIAMKFACLYPDKLNKLIIIDIAPKRYNDNHSHIFQGLNKVIEHAKSKKEAHAILMDYVQDIVMVNFLLKGLFFSEANKANLKFNIAVLAKSINHLLGFSDPQLTFNKMVYFLSGSESNYIKASDSKAISAFFAKYQIINIKDAGHWIHFDQKEKFLNTINKILK